ncbi:MAG TPA: hypothetical protein VJV78_29260 [Polyangiales bacterium]|nr:hypothetical protein [Polyangiales bacterium]
MAQRPQSFRTALLIASLAVCCVETEACNDSVWLTTSPCDPLAAHERATELGEVVAAGRDAEGTVYVADRDPENPSTDRVFVSEGDTLVRKRNVGAGSLGTSDFTWSFEDGSGSKRLVAHKEGDTVTGIALASPDEKTFFSDLDASAQPLTPVAPSALGSFKVRNLSGDVTVEFVADVEDGSRIVVMRPTDDWDYEDFRLFDGKDGRLIERRTTFSGARSYRAFDFDLDGERWFIMFPSPLNSLGGELRREADQRTLMFTLVEPAVIDPDDRFECFDGD